MLPTEVGVENCSGVRAKVGEARRGFVRSSLGRDAESTESTYICNSSQVLSNQRNFFPPDNQVLTPKPPSAVDAGRTHELAK